MTSPGPTSSDAWDDLPEQLRVRSEKRAALLSAGRTLYALTERPTYTLAAIRSGWAELGADKHSGVVVTVVARVVRVRVTGKLCFARLRDGDGTELQAMLSLADVGAEALADFKAYVDLGDLVAVTGEVIGSRSGELSVNAAQWSMVSKALRPLPVEHKPLSEESRVRQRYLDLIGSPDARQMVRTRAAITDAVRTSLRERGYLEVETPILQNLHGGSAKPFSTRFNALGTTVYLRTNFELALKKALVGGIHRVFELGRSFRNEGLDATHSAEFTELEAYEAFGDLASMAELIRAIVLDAAQAAGGPLVPDGRGGQLDLSRGWSWLGIHDAVAANVGEAVDLDTDPDTLRRLAAMHEVDVTGRVSAGEIVLVLFEKLVEPTLREPTFVYRYPTDVRPLASPNPDDPRLAEAFDLIVLGTELAPAYTELADPVVQRQRLVEQARRAAAGDEEAMQLDEDFLRALEHGMPPAGGMGMGIDRLVMLLTGVTGIRDTILFPAVRPERS